MSGRKRFPILSLIPSILFVLMLTLFASCGDKPTATDMEPGNGNLSGKGTIDPGASAPFLLGSVSDSSFAPGRIEIWAMDIAYDSTAGIVSFDVQLLNYTTRDVYPSIHFVITNIIPGTVSVVDFDGVSGDGFPFFDFSAKLGSDNVLSPGERTEPVTMKFHTVEARSFAIGFRIDLGPLPGGGMITGVVFRDDNRDGVRERCDRCEPGIAGITVVLERDVGSNDKVILRVRTLRDGSYRFAGLREGVYKVYVVAPTDMWEVTSTNPLLVALVKGPDGQVQNFHGANFGLFPINEPIPGNVLFGPIIIGPLSHYGTLLDSTFANPPSLLPVVYTYYLEVTEPPFMRPSRGVVDSASAWINDKFVFSYKNPFPPDTAYFAPQKIELPDSLVRIGENGIRLFTDGSEDAALMWRVLREP